MSVLVTGATGRVGRRVVDQVLAAGEHVRALTRTPEKANFPVEVEVVHGDLTHPESLQRAVKGVESAYLFPLPDAAPEFARLAAAAGVRRIVVLSSSSVLDEDEANYSGAYHRAVEQAVAAQDVEWAFVRPDEFASNVLWKWGHSIRSERTVRAAYPRAARALIHEADVADVAATALLDDTSAGEAYELTGPESLTQVEQVRLIGEALGMEIRFEEITHAAAREEMLHFMPGPVVNMVLSYLAKSEGQEATVLPTVQEVTGKPGRHFKEWAAEHRAEFS